MKLVDSGVGKDDGDLALEQIRSWRRHRPGACAQPDDRVQIQGSRPARALSSRTQRSNQVSDRCLGVITGQNRSSPVTVLEPLKGRAASYDWMSCAVRSFMHRDGYEHTNADHDGV